MIYVNARFLTQPITGVQRYSLEISLQLKQLMPSIRFVAPQNVIHPEMVEALGVELVGSRTGHAWEQIDLPRFLRSNGSPLLVNLANTAPLLYGNKISTLHDIAFERFPKTSRGSFAWPISWLPLEHQTLTQGADRQPFLQTRDLRDLQHAG